MATTAFSTPGPKVTAVLEYILDKYEVLEPGLGTVPTIEGIFKDEELQRILIGISFEEAAKAAEDKEEPEKKVIKKKTPSKKKSTPKKAKVSANLEERNEEKFDDSRCSARKWEAEGGLGYDNIQCSSCKKISKEDAEDTLNEFKEKITEEQLASLPAYLDAYDGCYCKNHLKQDFFMPKGWWLGKVNEDRPEKPMLPKGSFKDGYTEEYKEHRWMYDEEGNKNERASNRGRKCVSKKVAKEEQVEKPVEKVEENQDPIPEEDDGKGTGLKKVEKVEEDESEKAFEDEDDKEEEHSYDVDGVEYKKMWDEDDEQWCITIETDDGMQMVGFPKKDGGIEWADDEEEEAHTQRVK